MEHDPGSLTVPQLKAIMGSEDLQHESLIKCAGNPLWWFWNYTWSHDEHDKTDPYKMTPRRPHILTVGNAWVAGRLILILKSRQMWMSWLMCQLHLHLAMYRERVLVIVQSKKQEDADDLLSRMWYTHSRLPHWLKTPGVRKANRITFPGIGSEIRAVPQGADQIRQHVPTAILSDETAFQTEAEASFLAAQPCVSGGGRYTGLSSSNRGFYMDLCAGLQQAQPRVITKPLTIEVNKAGYTVIRLHHTADPIKWTDEAVAELQAGMTPWAFAREMDMDPWAAGGQPVYPMFTPHIHVTASPPMDMSRTTVYAGMDHGRIHPAVYLIIRVNRDGHIFVEDIYYEPNRTIAEHCAGIKRLKDFRLVRVAYLDPSANKVQDASHLTIADEYRKGGVGTTPAKSSDEARGISVVGDYLTASLVHAGLRTSKELENHPRMYVHPRCIPLINEMKSWSWKEGKDTPEDKGNDACDSLRYVTLSRPSYMQPKRRGGDFDCFTMWNNNE